MSFLGIFFIKSHLNRYPTSINLNYNWSFGFLTGIFLLIQIISGFLLASHYIAFIDIVFENMEHIMRDVNSGWLLRYLHANSASFFFICMYIHIFRNLFYKSYFKPRNLIWTSGVIILILAIIIAFIGYVLPWGQTSYWGATVITNLVTAIPKIGSDTILWIWGGFVVQGATLTRFYNFHYLFAFLLVFLVLIHLSLLHEVGSSSPKGHVVWKEKIKFYRNFYLKDLFILFIFLFFLFWIIFYTPNLLGHSDNYIKANSLVTPTHIVPEWYFLPFYAILRSIEDKLLGVIAMLSSLLILLILPFFQTYLKNLLSGIVLIDHFFFISFTCLITLLWFIGLLSPIFPYTVYGKYLTFLYFFLFLGQFITSRIENRLIINI